MNLRFDEHWWFVGLIALVPVAYFSLRWFHAMSGVRKGTVVVFRAALIGLLLALLAGTTLVRETTRLAVIGVVDVSGSVKSFYRSAPDATGRELSVEEAATNLLLAGSRNRRPDDLAGVIVFGSEPTPVAAVGPGSLRVAGASPMSLTGGTNIERALTLAGAMIPPDAVGRIVLFSDGVSTDGRVESAIAGVGTGKRRTPVDVVPLTYQVERESFVESVDSPPTAAAGATVAVRVVIQSTVAGSGQLSLLREGEQLDINGAAEGFSRRITVQAGTHVEVVNVPLPQGRVHRFESQWLPDGSGLDTISANNAGETFTITPGKGSVLIVDGVSGGSSGTPGDALATALRTGGIEVRSIGPEGLLADLLWLQQFDLIILQDVSADSVARETHAALVNCVTTLGTGLIMVGGPGSFGAGGWKGSALEPVLPVQLDLPERLVTPAAALVLIIDNSGSMNRSVLGSVRTQQQIANDGAAIAVESLDKSDLVSVVTFNSEHTVNVPLTPNRDPKATGRLIRGLTADGGTNLPPALVEASRMLRSAKAEVKHIIVLSDGVSQGAEQLVGMASAIGRENIRVSTIAIGDAADVEVMREMAGAGRGEFYRVIDPMMLPRVLLKAVRIIRTPLVREQPFIPVTLQTGSSVMEGLPDPLPPLDGLVLTQARPERTIVYPLITPEIKDRNAESPSGGSEPVLAYWNVGIGRVAAFTSDARPDRWAQEWAGQGRGDVYSRFWLQLVRAIARPPSDRTQMLSMVFGDPGASDRGDRALIRLETADEAGDTSGTDALTVPGTMYGPDGTPKPITLDQVGPGTFEASVVAREPGTYVVTLAPRMGNRAPTPVIGGVTRPAGAEYRRLSSDEASLRGVAERTGGRVLSMSASGSEVPDFFDRRGLAPAEARQPLTHLLLVSALAVMLLDVATRRIAWDRLFSREFGAELARNTAAAMRDRTEQARAAAARLRTHDEGTAATPEPSMALGDEDAANIRAEQAARRRAAREEARRAAREEPSAAKESPARGAPVEERPSDAATGSGPTVADSASPEPDADAGGLLAAKRRARRKMDE